MVAISCPIWSLGCCDDDSPLGDFDSVTKFREWCEECGFDELLLLPLNSHLIDTRLHTLRRNLVNVSPTDDHETVLEQFCTRYVSDRPEILLERCPYYSCSAFAVSPIWYPIKHLNDQDDGSEQDDRADALYKYFKIQYAHSKMDDSNHDESVLELWSVTWITKLIHLVIKYKSQPFNHDIVIQHVISLLSDSQNMVTPEKEDANLCAHTHVNNKIAPHQENSPDQDGTDNFCQWISLNAYWALSFGLWEALSDEFASIQLEEMIAKGGLFYPQHTANWNEWQIGPYSVELLLYVLSQALNIDRIAGIKHLAKGSAKTEHQSSEEQENVVGSHRRVGMGVRLLKNTQALKELFLFSLFTQWQIDEEWQRRNVKVGNMSKRTRLVGDIPIYVPTSSADTWSYPSLFNMDARDGALRPKYVSGLPPDYWSKDGQLWGTPCYDWDNHYGQLIRFWEERIKRNLNFFDMIRLDHYRAFADYWGIPEALARRDKSSRSGSWRPGPGSRFFYKILCDLDVCSTKFIVEDLGEETPLFNSLKAECPFANMSVLQFVLDEAIQEAISNQSELIETTPLVVETSQLEATELEPTPLEVVQPSMDEVTPSVDATSTTVPPQEVSSQTKLRIPKSTLLFTSTHDNPALQKWLDDMDPTRKAAVNRVTSIPLRILDSCIGGRTLVIWLIENHKSLRCRNERPCFHPSHTSPRVCDPPGSALCIHLPDLISAPACINVPGKISGTDLWSWNLSIQDWETMNTLVFKSWVRSLIATHDSPPL